MININRLTRPRVGLGLLTMGLVLGVSACDVEDDILNVDDPDVVYSVDDPALLPDLTNGAVREFYGAYAGFGGGDSYMTVSALITDEFTSAGTFSTRNATDTRSQFPIAVGNTSDGTYVNFQQARYQLGVAADRIAEAEGTDDPLYGLAKAMEGYTIQALAEGFCSGLPLSEIEGAPDVQSGYVYGSALSTQQLLTRAKESFNAAIASGNSVNLASLGLARALLHEGEYGQAAAAVEDIPTLWTHKVPFSPVAGTNTIFELQLNGRYTIPNNEGTNGLAFRGANDPRVQWTLTRFGFDRRTFLYAATKYHNREAPVILASGVEARLVEAEAALNANDFDGMIDILNDLRAAVDELMFNFNSIYSPTFNGYGNYFVVSNQIGGTGTLAPLTAQGSFAANRDLLFQERAFWLYLTGQRLGDMRRLIRDYGVPADQVFPIGNRASAPQGRGGPYGDDVVLPVSFNEINNPNYDLSSCNVDSVN